MNRLLILFVLVLAPAVFSQSSCPPDLNGTVPTVQNKGLPSSDICFDCRELNRFPQDFSNDAWNYIRTGDGAFTYQYYFAQTVTIGSSSTQMTIRSCSGLGQCANTTIVTVFNMITVPVHGIQTPFRKSIAYWKVITKLPSGATRVSEYMKSAETNEPKPVPSTPTDDGYTPGVDCLFNNGYRRDGGSSSDPGPSNPYPGCTPTTCGGHRK